MSVYIYLNRLISCESIDKGLIKTTLEGHRELPILERIVENFTKELWKNRFDYHIKHMFTKNLPYSI